MEAKKDRSIHFSWLAIFFAVSFYLATTTWLSAQDKAVSAAYPSNYTPRPGDTIAVDIQFDMSASSDLLGSFTGSLRWDPGVLGLLSHSGITSGFSGFVNTDETATGSVSFNGANPNGGTDTLAVLAISFEVIGDENDSTVLDLDYSAVSAARTFTNLLPILTVIDSTIIVRTATGIQEKTITPEGFILWQNYPNPFNPSTRIEFEVPEVWHGEATLQIFNLYGQRVRTLVRGTLSPGHHEVVWNGRDDAGKKVSSGAYFYKMVSENSYAVRKMLFAK